MDQSSEPLAPTRIRQKSSSMRHTRWTQEEDDLLTRLVSNSEHVNWAEIAKQIPGKTVQQIAERWGKVVNPKLVKGSWTRQEDETIILFVKQYGVKNWTKLASILPGRIGKQCRERWRNHLDPDINRNPWTPEEDELLLKLHEQFGNQWVKISSLIPGRSDNAIKNRWNSSLKKNPSITVHATPTPIISTPKIDTPTSIEASFPIPNLPLISTPSTIEDATPIVKSNFDVISPFVPMKSPYGFGSPFLNLNNKVSEGVLWSPEVLQTPQSVNTLFSPILRSPFISQSENSGSLLNALDELNQK